jgi:outer membrane protein
MGSTRTMRARRAAFRAGVAAGALALAASSASGQSPARIAAASERSESARIAAVSERSESARVAPPVGRGADLLAAANELPETIRPRAGGLTADGAAARAVRGSFAVQAASAGLRVAELQQSEAGWAMLPTISASFRYTRLSDITPGTIPFFNTPGCLMNIAACQMNPNSFVQNVVLQQPILNNFNFRLSMTIPVTDIPLRLREFYVAAGLQAEARRLDLEVQRASAALQARESFYEYVRALGAVAASEQALALVRRRRDDVRQLAEVGVLARSEVPAVESAVAGAELRVVQARNLLSLMELQLRQRARIPASEPLVVGEAVDDPVGLPSEGLAAMVDSATHSRPELLSIERQVRALDAQQRATVAGWFPSVAVVANADFANPNQRIFPQREGEFIPTWDVTAQVQWTPNQLLSGTVAAARLDAQRAQILAQIAQLRDGLETEVRAQYNGMLGAQAAIASARAALTAARETYRVRRERLAAGATTQTELSDAETQLFGAQVGLVNALVDLRLAAARLRRASGASDAAARDAVASR